MAAKKDNLPLTIDKDTGSTSTITYANEVIAIISGVAAAEVEGIAGMCTSGGISDVFGRNRNITKGVKVEIGSEEASVDLYVTVEYGTPIQKAAADVQENVRKAIETMTGLHVVRVDVHVQGVSFDKENKELQAGIETLTEAENDSQVKFSKKEEPAKEEPAKAEAAPETATEEAPDQSAQEQPVMDESASEASENADNTTENTENTENTETAE